MSAVGGLIENDQRQLLLVRRAQDPGKGKWGLPGGFVDRDETAEEAMIREVREETQLQVQSLRFMMTHPNQYDYRGIVAPVIDLFYLCRVQGDVQLAEDELEHFEWTTPTSQHLDNMAFYSNRLAIEFWLTLSD